MFKKSFYLIMVLVLVASMSLGVFSQEKEELPREQTLAIGGDESYCGNGFNPYGLGGWATYNRALSLTYMTLFYYNWGNGQLEPWLAESYEWSEDGKTLIVHLQPTAVWRDGTPVTADDVVFSKETLDQYGNFPIEKTVIESVTAADALTVNINVVDGKEFTNNALNNLENTPVISKARWEGLVKEQGAEISGYLNTDYAEIDSSGPYKPILGEFTRSVYERVDDWWGNDIFGQPAPKYVMVLEYATNDLEQRAFDDGVLDWTDSFTAGSYEYVTTHDDVVCWDKENADGKIFNTAGAIYMVPNMTSTDHPELAEPWLRQAVAYAIDLDQIIDIAQEGLPFKANPSFITSSTLGDEYTDWDLIEGTYGDRVIPHDPEKAIEILQENCEGSVEDGWTWNGNPVGPWQINSVAGWSDVNLMCELIQQQLAEVGLKMELNLLDYDLHMTRMQEMDFDWIDFILLGTNPSAIYPIQNYDTLFRWEPPLGDLCGYKSSPNYDAVNNLILKMWELPIGSDESIEVAKEIQALVVPELPYIPLYVQTPWTRFHTTYWEGWPTVDNPVGIGQGSTWWEYPIPIVVLNVQAAK